MYCLETVQIKFCTQTGPEMLDLLRNFQTCHENKLKFSYRSSFGTAFLVMVFFFFFYVILQHLLNSSVSGYFFVLK